MIAGAKNVEGPMGAGGGAGGDDGGREFIDGVLRSCGERKLESCWKEQYGQFLRGLRNEKVGKLLEGAVWAILKRS